MTHNNFPVLMWTSLPVKIFRRIFEVGFFDTLKWFRLHLSALYREWNLGIKTVKNLGPEMLGYDSECEGYEPISYVCFDTAMHTVDIRPEESVFLDYGSGMGRALILAAQYPFKKVIGVELSQKLCNIAQENVKRAWKNLECKDIEIICKDARSFTLPSDITTIFIWNSFTGSILSSVFERIRESLEKSPRPLTLLYLLPYKEKDMLAEFDYFETRRELKTDFWTGIKIIVYESKKSVGTTHPKVENFNINS